VALSPTQAWVDKLSTTVLKSAAYCNWKWSQARGRSSLVPLASSLLVLFFAVLGDLGQFGIITKARILLVPAPQKVVYCTVAQAAACCCSSPST